MLPSTAREYRRYQQSFARFQAARPGPLADQVRAFLARLTPAPAGVARSALKALGLPVDWRALPAPRYRRNLARLQATMLTDEEMAALLPGLSPPDRALVGCLWTLRRLEVCRLRWSDLDLSQGVVYVPRGKGDKPGWTLLTPGARMALDQWVRLTGSPENGAPVFPSLSTPAAVGRRVATLLRRAGLTRPGRGAHAFRRSFATRFLRQTHDLRALQQLLRHESIQTTATYCYPSPEELTPLLVSLGL